MSIEMNDEYKPEGEIRYLGDVQRLQLEPGDLVVITYSGRLSEEARAYLAKYVSESLGRDVLVLDNGAQIGVMGKEVITNGAH
jgi:hypothetical protein